jgi:hypothetical protein
MLFDQQHSMHRSNSAALNPHLLRPLWASLLAFLVRVLPRLAPLITSGCLGRAPSGPRLGRGAWGGSILVLGILALGRALAFLRMCGMTRTSEQPQAVRTEQVQAVNCTLRTLVVRTPARDEMPPAGDGTLPPAFSAACNGNTVNHTFQHF